EFRKGSLTGPVIATVNSFNTDTWYTFVDSSVNLTQTLSGVNDIYVKFVGGIGVINLKSFQFVKGTVAAPLAQNPPAAQQPPTTQNPPDTRAPANTKDAFNTILAINYDAESGTVIENGASMGYLDD